MAAPTGVGGGFPPMNWLTFALALFFLVFTCMILIGFGY
jgi:hypothetical protein